LRLAPPIGQRRITRRARRFDNFRRALVKICYDSRHETDANRLARTVERLRGFDAGARSKTLRRVSANIDSRTIARY
jgi:hypothetical protein